MAQPKYSKYQVKVPIREVGANLKVKGVTLPTRTYMSNKLVPGCNVYLEFTWIHEMPEPSFVVPAIHSHPYDQVTLTIGSDPHNPEYLGAEIEFVVGDEKLIIDKTSAVYLPKGLKHGPLTWKRFEKPHIEMAIMLGAGSLEQARMGGLEQ